MVMVTLTTGGHRVPRVHHEVQHGLLEAIRVGDDRRRGRVERELEGDAVAEDLVEQLAHTEEHLVQVERLGLVDAASAERHEVVGEGGGPVGGALHRVDAGPGRVEHLEVVLEQLDLPAHHRQHVVEVVGDAAREPADRLHLLGVEQLLLEELALGDVAEHDHLQLVAPVDAAEW